MRLSRDGKSATATSGCEQAGVGRTTVYGERQRDESFALAWADVEAGLTLHLESRALALDS